MSDTILGTSFDDVIHDTSGQTFISALDGNDTIYIHETSSNSRENTIDGGSGSDLLSYRYATAGVHVNTYNNGLQDHFYNVEIVEGSQFGDLFQASSTYTVEFHGLGGNDRINGFTLDDLLFGDAGDDSVYGNDGNDTLWGGKGDDKLHGNDGDDWLSGDKGNDTVTGGLGQDTAYGGNGNDYLSDTGGDDWLWGQKGNDTIYAGSGDDYAHGGAQDDVVHAGAGNDTAVGGGGNDLLYGSLGDDLVLGQSGNDGLFGDDGNDDLRGSVGTDTLNGGAGDDVLSGGADSDAFIFQAGSGNDTVTDFEALPLGGDQIDVSSYFADFLAVSAASSQVGANVVITLGPTESITLQNIDLTDLTADHFLF